MSLPGYTNDHLELLHLTMTTIPHCLDTLKDTVCHVIAVFRHGERAPIMFSPSDPNKNFWPNGAGTLTNTGKEDGYLIGKFLRERYSKLLSEKYVGDEIYVRSTDVDRNLMTAQCCLAGLYPPKDDDIWMPGMTWQPVPVHTIPFTNDPLIPKLSASITLPVGGFQKDDEIAALQIISMNQGVLDALALDARIEGNLGVVSLLLDTFLIEVGEGLTGYLPEGLKLSREEVATLADSIYLLTCKTGKCVISAAHLLEEILMQQSKKIRGEVGKQKAFLYTMHDLTISACLEMFNYTSKTNYGGILLFELHKHPKMNEYFIQIVFKAGIRDTADPVIIPVFNCKFMPMCTFERLVRIYASRNRV